MILSPVSMAILSLPSEFASNCKILPLWPLSISISTHSSALRTILLAFRVCAQIGVRATGDYEKDYAAFNSAIQLLSQSAIDGQAMTYFAGLRSEASRIFAPQVEKHQAPISFEVYQAQFLT